MTTRPMQRKFIFSYWFKASSTLRILFPRSLTFIHINWRLSLERSLLPVWYRVYSTDLSILTPSSTPRILFPRSSTFPPISWRLSLAYLYYQSDIVSIVPICLYLHHRLHQEFCFRGRQLFLPLAEGCHWVDFCYQSDIVSIVPICLYLHHRLHQEFCFRGRQLFLPLAEDCHWGDLCYQSDTEKYYTVIKWSQSTSFYCYWKMNFFPMGVETKVLFYNIAFPLKLQIYFKYRCLWNTNAPLPQHIKNRLELWLWPFTRWLEYQYVSSTHHWPSTYQVWRFWGKAFLSYQLHKGWETNMTFDLALWPTDPNMNRDHLLIKDYLPTKFEASWAKNSWVISCIRWSRQAWTLTLTFDLLTWISIGIIYSSRTTYLPCLKLLGRSVLELSVAQGIGDQHDLWPWPMTYWPEYQ